MLFLAYVSHWLPLPLLDRLDRLAYDFRLRSTLLNQPDPRIVILDIDEKSLRQQGHWPWSRDKIAALVDTLFEHYQISVLGFDVTFPEPDDSSAIQLLDALAAKPAAKTALEPLGLAALKARYAYDQRLAASFMNRPVVLSFFTSSQADAINPNSALPVPTGAIDNMLLADAVPKALSYGANLSSLQQSALHAGYFNNPSVDADGVYRRLPLLVRYDHQLYEAFALAIFRAYLGMPPLETVTEDPNTQQLEGLRLLDYWIPTGADSSLLVPYRGKQGSFSYYSIADVMSGSVPKQALDNRIVLIGTTAAGLMDLRSTPVQHVYPGVEIHANVVSGLLDGRVKSKPGYMQGFEILEILLLAGVVMGLFPRLSPRGSLVLLLVLAISIVAVNYYLWQVANIDSLVASPLLLLALLSSSQLAFAYVDTAQRKKYLSDLFGLYIPPELVKQMARSHQPIDLAGESRELTVLFSDIRGFTTISEALEPHELCDLINQVLTPITQVIHQHHGTIDKYIGDAVMAFWGAPLNDDHHARHAVGAALAVLPALEALNRQFLLRGWPDIHIGIGINTGRMSVGNMGSNFRMAYTVMGDAVNLGSRLEGLTKQYGVTIIVSESTRQQAPDFVYRELDRVTVKGKRIPITIYEPLGLQDQLDDGTRQALVCLESALQAYRQQDWGDAAQRFSGLAEVYPRDGLYRLYLERIAYFKNTPPPDDWAGVFEHTSK